MEFDVVHQQSKVYSTKDKSFTWRCTCGEAGDADTITEVNIIADTHNEVVHEGAKIDDHS